MRAIIIVVLALSGCVSESDQADARKRRDTMNDVRVAAWQACIDRGGMPVESFWVPAPAMERCEFNGATPARDLAGDE
jgi:hypothetical protein